MKITMGLFFIFTLNAWADCQISDGSKIITIPETKSVSLFEKGKSLETHKIQDQDGLGTCYANSTSAVLKSALPGHPDISYVHAALVSSTMGIRSDDWSQEKTHSKYVMPNSQFMEGTNTTCETIDTMQRYGGVCDTKFSLIENQDIYDSQIQKRVFEGLGKYFDQVNKVKSTPTLSANLKKDLSKIIEALKHKNAELMKICSDEKAQDFPIGPGIESIIYSKVFDIYDNLTPCGQERLVVLKSILTPQSSLKKDRMTVKISDTVLKKFQAIVSQDIELSKKLKGYLSQNSDKDTVAIQRSLGSPLLQKLNEFLVKEMNEVQTTGLCPDYDKKKSFLLNSGNEFERTLVMDMKAEKTKSCDDLLVSSHAKDLKKVLAPQCTNPNNLDLVIEAITPLMDLGASIDQALLKGLSNPKSIYADQLTNLLIPGCSDKTKLIPLKNIKCESYPSCDENLSDISNKIYKGKPKGCLTNEEIKKNMRKQFISSINKNLAAGVRVCIDYVNNPEKSFKLCQNDAQGRQPPTHAMTISGYRCVDNKIEYEVLNSWGTSCPVKGNSPKGKYFECEVDEDANPTGKFWVKEDSLVDGSRGFFTISKGAK